MIILFELSFNTVCHTSLLFPAYEKIVYGCFNFSCLSSPWRLYTVYVKLRSIHVLETEQDIGLIVVDRVMIIPEIR